MWKIKKLRTVQIRTMGRRGGGGVGFGGNSITSITGRRANLEKSVVNDFIIDTPNTPVEAETQIGKSPGEFQILELENARNSEIIQGMQSHGCQIQEMGAMALTTLNHTRGCQLYLGEKNYVITSGDRIRFGRPVRLFGNAISLIKGWRAG